MKEPNKVIREDEIDLLELARVIWFKRHFILKVTSIFMVLGLLIAFTSKVEYEASCKLMPEIQEGMKSNLGGLSGLAGLAGIDFGAGGLGALTPELYPEIVNSVPFQLELIHKPVWFRKADTTISSYNYFKEFAGFSLLGFIKGYTIELPNKVKSFFVEGDDSVRVDREDHGQLIELSKEEIAFVENYRSRMDVSVDPKTGIISVVVEMPDAYAAASVADLLVKRLTEEIKNYKVGKLKNDLEFIHDRYLEAEGQYEGKQKQVALFADRNRNITSSLVQTEYQRLQNEMNILFEVYKGLATQLERAKIKVKEQTPIFTILEPVQVPVSKTKPRRKWILLISVFLGICYSVTHVLINDRFINFNK